MARCARLKVVGEPAWYHLYCGAAAYEGEHVLANSTVKHKLLGLFRHFSTIYMASIGGTCLMNTHYHVLVRFDAARALPREELMARALRMYPRSQRILEAWSDEHWERFQRRIFDVSEYMRNVQAAFAVWFNRTHHRKGRFWGDRFKSTLLMDGQAVLDCLLYIELNAVRAKLVQRPEDYTFGSAHLREIKEDGFLMPLSEIFGDDRPDLHAVYKEMLYHRGAIPTKEGQHAISPEVLAQETARGFQRSGVYAKKLRYFTDGLMLGGHALLLEKLAQLRRQGFYSRRKNPIPQSDGTHFSLREQRSHFVPL